jgi:ribosomal-protein-alanine N-acetyltransferase
VKERDRIGQSQSTPVLSEGSVTLSPFNDAFLTARYVGWLNDPETVQFSEQRHRTHTLATCAAYVEGMRSGGHHLWAISHAGGPGQPSIHVGNLSATIDPRNAIAEMGILIGEKLARGCGIGRCAWGLAARWLLTGRRLRKIWAGTMRANVAMAATARAAGMTPEGAQAAHFLLDGVPVDLILFGRLAGGDGR